MSFNFTTREFILNGGTGTPTFQFYRRGFNLNGSGSPSWQDIILSGNGSLTLTNAKANGLNYLKLFGGTSQRNLPVGYTQYDGLIGDGDAYIDLNCTLDQDDEIEIELSISSATTSRNLFGYRSSASSNNISALFGSTGTLVADFNNSDYSTYRLNETINTNTRYKLVINKTGRYLYQVSDGSLVGSNTNACADTISCSSTYLFNTAGQPGATAKFNGTIHRCLIKGKRDVVPCGNGTAYGMYDKLNGVFYPNANTEGSFTVGNATVPTPDTPMDIVSNNGTIKARHQSGLPLRYTLLDYVVFDSTQVIDTGFIPDNNSRIESKCYRTGGDCWFYGASPSNPRVTLYHSNAGTCRWGYQSRSNVGFVADTEYTIIEDKNGLTINGTLYPWTSGTADDFTCDRSLTIGNNNGSSGTRYFAGNFYYMKIYNNGVLVRDFVPCQNASNVVGLYDRVNGVFYTDTGLVAGTTVTDPIEIYTDGTVETVVSRGANLFNKSSYEEITAYVNANTGVLTQGTTQKCAVIPCEPNTTYIITNRTTSAWGSFTDKTIDSVATIFVTTSNVLTTGANDRYLIGLVRTTDGTYDYRDTLNVSVYGGTATAEMLLKVGDYQDVQSVLDGGVTRNCGVLVFDGTEDYWKDQISNNGRVFIRSYDINCISVTGRYEDFYCSHFLPTIASSPSAGSTAITSSGLFFWVQSGITTLTEWTNWLKVQYQAGTPVIVVYPLATATTETVTAQPLSIQAGTNIVEITQASIDNLGLEVSYKATV